MWPIFWTVTWTGSVICRRKMQEEELFFRTGGVLRSCVSGRNNEIKPGQICYISELIPLILSESKLFNHQQRAPSAHPDLISWWFLRGEVKGERCDACSQGWKQRRCGDILNRSEESSPFWRRKKKELKVNKEEMSLILVKDRKTFLAANVCSELLCRLM